MGLETATYAEDLVITNPVASDDIDEGDDHIRLTKTVFQKHVADSVGMVAAFAGTPPGAAGSWLLCDGSAVSRTTYSALFAVISDDYGNGDGSTTFNLPDYRGEFLRGTDSGAGNDPDAASRTDRGDTTTGDAVGTKQADAFESHVHNVPPRSSTSGTQTGDGFTYSSATTTGTDTDSTGGNETRPRNVGVLFYILAR